MSDHQSQIGSSSTSNNTSMGVLPLLDDGGDVISTSDYFDVDLLLALMDSTAEVDNGVPIPHSTEMSISPTIGTEHCSATHASVSENNITQSPLPNDNVQQLPVLDGNVCAVLDAFQLGSNQLDNFKTPRAAETHAMISSPRRRKQAYTELRQDTAEEPLATEVECSPPKQIRLHMLCPDSADSEDKKRKIEKAIKSRQHRDSKKSVAEDLLRDNNNLSQKVRELEIENAGLKAAFDQQTTLVDVLLSLIPKEALDSIVPRSRSKTQ